MTTPTPTATPTPPIDCDIKPDMSSLQPEAASTPPGLPCRQAQNDAARARFRRKAQERLPADVRQELLDAIYSGQPFRTALGDLGLTSNQVWGLTKTDQEWSATLEAALGAARRDDLKHGTDAADVRGCVCGERREHQRVRMGESRG